MDILIKNMEMPSCCSSCPFLYAHYGEMGCRFIGRIKEIFSPNRPKNCPLIPVPEHGDLIDRDALKEDAKWIQRNDTGFFIDSMSYGEALSRAVDEAEVVLERTT